MIAPAVLDEAGKPLDFSTLVEQMRLTYANAAKVRAQFGASLDDAVGDALSARRG
jgi:hypothetical protein